MPESPIETFFSEHLLICRIPGTKVTESGLTVSIKPDPNETFHFYHTDTQKAREIFCMPQNQQKCCDYLLFYTKQAALKKEIICLLELKGTDFEHSVKQVINTYQYLKRLLARHLQASVHKQAIHSVNITLHGRSPSPKAARKGREQLKQVFGHDMLIRIKHKVNHDKELGTFLRRIFDCYQSKA